MTITVRYNGTCCQCGRSVPAGTTANWDKATRRVSHVKCPVALPAVPADAVRRTLAGESKLDAPKIGSVRRDRRTGEYFTILRCRAEYVPEDGLSFGLDDESGWLFELTCRPATADEMAPLVAEQEAAVAKLAAAARTRAIAKEIRTLGERPEGRHTPDGQIILDTHTIYGGGDWFVIDEPLFIWYCRNNGADGDDWSRNNVATGGAGAIGWRIPFDQAIADELLAIAERS